MSNINVNHSSVSNHNLLITRGSRVQNHNLILDERDINYVRRYSPAVMKENKTMLTLYDVQRDEITVLHDDINKVINNNFLQTLDLDGIQKWEKILKIEPDNSASESTRMDVILMKRFFRPPLTRQNFQKILEGIWDEGNYIFEIDFENLQLIIDIETDDPVTYLKFQRYVRSLVPANIYLIFAVQYTYLYLKRNYSYSNLSALTYAELSQYA